MRRIVVAVAAIASGCSVLVDSGGLTGGPTAAPSDNADAAASDRSASFGDAGGDDTKDGGGAGPSSPDDFIDLFDRPDGPVGNGWLENVTDVFSLSGGRLIAKSGDWVDRYIYRPPTEDALDAEASVEIRWKTTTPADCDPSVWLRTQRSAGTASAYVAYIDDRDALTISRLQKNKEIGLDEKPLPSPVNTNDVYRMRFRVEGTSPVHLVATFERSTAEGWSALATLTVDESGDGKIVTPGTVALAGDWNATFSYDAFTLIKLH